MKKIIALPALLFLFCTACTKQVEQNDLTTTDKTEVLTQTTHQTTTEATTFPEPDGSPEPRPKEYRPIFYDLAGSFSNLVGREARAKWQENRLENNYEQYENECIAVSYVRHFNISKEDFARANEEVRQIWASIGHSPEDRMVLIL